MFFSSAISRMPHSKATKYFGQVRKDVVDFSIGEPKDEPPESVIAAYAESVKHGSNRYTPVQGLLELREKLAAKLSGQNGICASSEEILITGGASEAIAFSIFSLVNPGDEVIIVEPSYPIASSLVNFAGGKPVSLLLKAEDNFLPDLEKLKELINEKTKMLVINTPHNPTGAVFGKNSLRAISEIFGGTILSDEVYENFSYNEEHRSMASLASRPENIITVNSFSKTYAMCGYRVGYLHARKELIAQMLKLKLCISTCTSNPSQKAAIAALEDHEFPKAIKKKFEERRNILVQGLKSSGMRFVEPKSAFYVFPDVTEFGGDGKAFDFFIRAGVLTMPGSVFYDGCTNNVRFSFVSRADEIENGIKRLKNALL